MSASMKSSAEARKRRDQVWFWHSTGVSQAEIARKLKVSRQRVQQLLLKAHADRGEPYQTKTGALIVHGDR